LVISASRLRSFIISSAKSSTGLYIMCESLFFLAGWALATGLIESDPSGLGAKSIFLSWMDFDRFIKELGLLNGLATYYALILNRLTWSGFFSVD